MKIRSYEEAIEYLESFIGKIRFEITLEFIKKHDPLERMRVLLSLLGNPQNKFPSILVGGTSGKGSTAYLISHILTTAGYKTGLTLSPHLQRINERIQINGKPISDEEFTELVSSIVQTIELMKKMKLGAPSYFEILIAMAFLYFAKAKVDIAVVEVGMGGEFDATNTLYPLVAVITNVSLDHTNVLGSTVEKIARTKAGIIKEFHQCHPEFILRQAQDGELAESISGSPARRQVFLQPNEMLNRVQHDKNKKPIVITGVKQPSVIKIVEDRCKEVGVELFRLGKNFDYRVKKETIDGSVFDVTINDGREGKLHVLQDLRLLLLGRYQVENACLAIETVLQLRKFGLKVSVDDIRKALKTAFFPGRFEIVSVIDSPLSVLGKQSIRYRSVGLETGEQKTGKPEAENRKQKTDNRISHTLILDGAHNPTKMKEFLKSLKKLFPAEKKIFVVGFKFDKDVRKILEQILQVANSVVVTKFHVKTDLSKNASMKLKSIKYYVSSSKDNGDVYYEENLKLAIDKAFHISGRDDLIIVTGSLYLVGEVRNML